MKSRSLVLLGTLLALPLPVSGQTPPPTTSLLANLQFRQLGPTNMGGRVADIAVFEKEPRIFYTATAGGGLWKTVNGGITFQVVFDKGSSGSLGAVAVSQTNPDIVYIGTGEASSRNSVAWGDGVYRSNDGGKTWTHLGLVETRQIAKIAIHPDNPDVAYVAALGNLWGASKERGVYKTTDGGKTWSQVLAVDDRTGAVDLQMDPKRPDTLMAAMWQRVRKPYDFISGGPGSGLYKTTNGGRNWRRVSRGLPAGSPLGRIGISYFRKDPRHLVASVEYKAPPAPAAATAPAPAGQPGAQPRRPVSFNGGGVFRSSDGGETWVKASDLNPRPFYFSMPRQDPVELDRVYLPAINMHVSSDGAKTFEAIRLSVHVDFHAMWINPADPNHLIVGSDGGVAQSRDRGATWEHLNSMPIGQFYAVAYDMRKPYWVYGGLQDNGSWGLPTQTIKGGPGFWDAIGVAGGDGFHVAVDPDDPYTVYAESQGGAAVRVDLKSGAQKGIRPRPPQGETYRYNWSTPIILSPHNPQTLYLGGNRLFRSVNRGDAWTVVSPDLTTNDLAKQSVGKLSVTPEDTGAERHCTIVTISESPLKQGLLYVGTDDGLVQMTHDDGKTWTNLTASIPDLPANTWCSRVLASKFVEGRVYATFDGHRDNDFKPYVFVSEDYGKSWTKLHASLPDWDSIYVICEGERNPDLLFLGSEHSLRVSLDRGLSWTRLNGGVAPAPSAANVGPFSTGAGTAAPVNYFPTVAVHDLKIHRREGDLIVGTHGRSIWTVDVNGLEGLSAETLKSEAAVFAPQNVYRLGLVSGNSWGGDRHFQATNTQPGTTVYYYLRSDAAVPPKIVITDAAGKASQELPGSGKAGLNAVRWNGRIGNRLVEAGDYRVVLKTAEKEYSTSVKVEDAPLAD
ncbi:MAG TPA: hypothetical protein VGE01_13950 [Fimbriimonas sp.]